MAVAGEGMVIELLKGFKEEAAARDTASGMATYHVISVINQQTVVK